MSARVSRRGIIVGTAAAGVVARAARAATDGLRLTGLQAENLNNPVGVQLPAVRLSWRLETAQRGTMQQAFAVGVASNLERLKAGDYDLWDSGRIEGTQSFDVAYGGKPLTSRQRAWWRVRVWDNHGRSASSEPAFWEMGLLQPSDWTAQWLAVEDEAMRGDRETGLNWIVGAAAGKGATSQLRLPFVLEADAELTVFVVATNGYRASIDGDALDTGGTKGFGDVPAVKCVTKAKAGAHVFAISVDGGKEAPQCAVMIRARLSDGRIVRFDSKAMRTSAEMPAGWMAPGFDDHGWAVAQPSQRPAAPFPGEGAFLLRHDFEARANIVRARLYVTALGAHETFLNGARVGDALLAPECTDFAKRILYRVHDVTGMLRPGGNAIGAMVGDGWYGSYTSPAGRFAFGPAPLRYLAQLEITYGDGRIETVSSGNGWSLSRAPVMQSEIYAGEDYDARLEQPGWAAPGFKGAGWTKAMAAPPAAGRLEGAISPPIRRMAELKPQSVTAKDGGYVIDFGQNFSGWVRLKVRGQAGQRVTLRFAEVLKPDGTVDQSNLRAARAADSYVLKGDPAGETWEPRFTYHGFRYVQVSGLGSPPKAGDVTGIVVHSALPETGHLRIANPLVQKLWQNTLWSQRSNFMGIPTDCPQRDERLGWMGDAHVFWDAASFNMNVAAFTERWMGDVRDAQAADGCYSNVSPNTLGGVSFGHGAPGWADAGVILPWTVWKRFGDTAIIDQHWDSMTRYIAFIQASSDDFVWKRNHGADFGDWLSLDSRWPGDDTTPKDLIATAMSKHSTDALADMARATGRRDDAVRYEALAANIKAGFIRAFVKDDGTVSNDSQTGYILALHYGLLPDALRGAAAVKLRDNIVRRGNLLTTGFLGTPFSLDVLADAGYSAMVYDLLLRTAYPSWGYMVAHGATTIWERWNGDTGDVSMNSFNHYALGAVTGFVFRRIAGIDPLTPGFASFAVNPVLDGRVKSGGGDYDAMPGRISTDWTQGAGGAFSLSVTVPPNSRARVHLPAKDAARICEGGRAIGGRTDIKVAGVEGGRLVVEIGSGTYRFAVG